MSIRLPLFGEYPVIHKPWFINPGLTLYIYIIVLYIYSQVCILYTHNMHTLFHYKHVQTIRVSGEALQLQRGVRCVRLNPGSDQPFPPRSLVSMSLNHSAIFWQYLTSYGASFDYFYYVTSLGNTGHVSILFGHFVCATLFCACIRPQTRRLSFAAFVRRSEELER